MRNCAWRYLTVLAAVVFATLTQATASAEQNSQPLKLGVLTDMSGAYMDIAGPGSVEAVRMAVEDIGGQVLGRTIEVISADHQHKTDTGAAIARRWYEREGVDAIFDVINSSVALAVQEIARNSGKFVFQTSSVTPTLTGTACLASGPHWALDSYALTRGLANALINDGADSWFFITGNYAAGHGSEANFREVLAERKVNDVGYVRFPLNSSDFSSYILMAQSSNAKVIAGISGGQDTINLLKQSSEFGVPSAKQRLVFPSVFISDIHSVGLKAAKGLTFMNSFYWDKDEQSRRWANRYFAKMKTMPGENHAMTYSAASHYLKAIRAAGTTETAAVVKALRNLPIDDAVIHNGSLRSDGRVLMDVNLVTVKSPDESKGEWDYYRIVRMLPASEVFLPLEKSKCPLK